ncbi:4-alpha-glucanotransferase [Desulfohalovibrio reitneri]|uniref:4-alpha-glucanotransferase n=1 Tax=Desulfohalovibrio reitneri TaxID=1307759 RepID=UPI0004A6B4C0|nr:4-alpha-glucanotransferase [Desulfohalovibrio reitneri]
MRRRSGVLLHLTSLPSAYGIGDLGPGAYWFADFLAETRQGVWQMLPINPTTPGIGNSPYSAISAFAANYMLISPDKLVADGWLDEGDVDSDGSWPEDKVDYSAVEEFKEDLLCRAYDRNFIRLAEDTLFHRFKDENAYWLDDFALFKAIKESRGGQMWTLWPRELRLREQGALREFAGEHRGRISQIKFNQYIFARQWADLRRHCMARRVHLMGDAPIYVTLDSADVWANPNLFKLDEDCQPTHVAGVPPDYFSETGQLWGNPVFDWDRLQERGFDWWIDRLRHNLSLFDFLRIDHFRGFAGYWEIEAGEETAINGEWVDAPGFEFFDALTTALPSLPIIAEDLGVITPDVRELRDAFRLPGMKILQFGFGDNVGDSHDAPHNYTRNCVAYTGTHDNNTTRGWFEEEATEKDKKHLFDYCGHAFTAERAPWEMIRLAQASVAELCLFPMQDLLCLGSEARMNIPAVSNGNWEWRLDAGLLNDGVKEQLLSLTKLFGRG